MSTTLESVTTDVLSRLDDEAASVWTRASISDFVKDGYNAFCRGSKCLFDVHVVENLAPIGNYSTQQEAYAGKLLGLATTGAFNFSAEFERDLAPPGAVGPVKCTAPDDRQWLDDLGCDTTVGVATLPDTTIEVRRAFYDYFPLLPEFGSNMRRIDRDFHDTEGDPDWFTMDSDGLFSIRLVARPGGDAAYDTVTGSWGTVRSESDFTTTIVGSWGLLREDTTAFPSGGPWGIPRRTHPDALNTVVEVSRLGKDLDSNLFEIPEAYIRYVVYYAMSKALRFSGPGQDVKLSDHFMERFDLGLVRIKRRMDSINKEFSGQLGRGGSTSPAFGMGLPRVPSQTNWSMVSPY